MKSSTLEKYFLNKETNFCSTYVAKRCNEWLSIINSAKYKDDIKGLLRMLRDE